MNENMTARVLIVEDDKDQCAGICRLLERHHIDATCAHTLSEGLTLSANCAFDVVLLDLGLPDAPDAGCTIDAIPKFGDAHVIVMTGHAEKGFIRDAIKKGADYCVKGDAVALMGRVLEAIERRSPHPMIEEAMVEVERDRRRETESAPPNQKMPVMLQWVPAVSLALAITIASLTGGAFLYRSISNQAARDQTTATRFTSIDKNFSSIDEILKEFKASIESMRSAEMAMKNDIALGAQDRLGIKNQSLLIAQQQNDFKNDLIRRLERIEDNQVALLKSGQPK